MFCDAEPEWSTVAERYNFVMWSQCGELLQEGMVLWYGDSVENYCKKVWFCGAEPVCRSVAGRYCFVIRSQGG